MKRLGILHPALNTPEIGAGASDLDNGQIFDIGFHYLRSMGLQGLLFFIQRVGNVHEYLGIEILGGRPLVKQHVADVAGCGHDRLGEVPVILVGVIGEVAEYKIRLDLGNNRFNFANQINIHDQMGVLVATPENLLNPHYFAGIPLFAGTYGSGSTQATTGHDQQINVMAFLGIFDQRTAASKFNIVRMSADCQNIYFFHDDASRA